MIVLMRHHHFFPPQAHQGNICGHDLDGVRALEGVQGDGPLGTCPSKVLPDVPLGEEGVCRAVVWGRGVGEGRDEGTEPVVPEEPGCPPTYLRKVLHDRAFPCPLSVPHRPAQRAKPSFSQTYDHHLGVTKSPNHMWLTYIRATTPQHIRIGW